MDSRLVVYNRNIIRSSWKHRSKNKWLVVRSCLNLIRCARRRLVSMQKLSLVWSRRSQINLHWISRHWCQLWINKLRYKRVNTSRHFNWYHFQSQNCRWCQRFSWFIRCYIWSHRSVLYTIRRVRCKRLFGPFHVDHIDSNKTEWPYSIWPWLLKKHIMVWKRN